MPWASKARGQGGSIRDFLASHSSPIPDMSARSSPLPCRLLAHRPLGWNDLATTGSSVRVGVLGMTELNLASSLGLARYVRAVLDEGRAERGGSSRPS